MPERKPLYKRVILKLSGEALSGNTDFGIDPLVLERLANEIADVVRNDVQLGVVIGGGNLFRGKELSQYGLSRISGDYMGMLGTLMNALAIRDVLEQNSLPSRVMSAIPMSGIVDHYDRRKQCIIWSRGVLLFLQQAPVIHWLPLIQLPAYVA